MANKDLEKLREVFLASDIDDEDYQDNLDKISEWENALRSSENFIAWQKDDVTREILSRAKLSYRENGVKLASDRNLDQIKINAIWAKQDALLLMINLIEGNHESTIKQINNEIKQALQIV
jgi:hypothetical protein